VREQYIHEAHTIIYWNESHLARYDEAVRQAQSALEHLQAVARTPRQREMAREIAVMARSVDADFRRSILPAIARNDHEAVQRLHDNAEALVSRVVVVIEELNKDFEMIADAARSRELALRSGARTLTAVFFSLAIVIAAVLAALIMRSILVPIARLRAGAAMIAKGDLGARIPVGGSDEFAELSIAFNHMAAELARREADLLRSQKLAAIGQLAAGVAHEINNPLAVVLGYTKLLQRDRATTADVEEGLQIIEDETRQCQRIVNALLDLARPPRLECERVDLAVVAREAANRLRETRVSNGAEINISSTETPAYVWGDPAKLRQVVSNVLINALEASAADGRVNVRVSANGDTVSLAVADSGAGVPADVLPQVFDPFFTTKPQGAGLGLAISQAIADAHGGRLELQSDPGKGTVVALHLPRCRDGKGERT
jgi:signal transduction histidine kinase